MREDVSTTPRKPLTPSQRLALFERRGGRCCVCGEKIIGAFIDEHWRPLGLGGSNDKTNRDVAHIDCAATKTKDDMQRINKAKAQKKAAHGIRREPRQEFARRPKSEKPPRDRLPIPDRKRDAFGRKLK